MFCLKFVFGFLHITFLNGNPALIPCYCDDYNRWIHTYHAVLYSHTVKQCEKLKEALSPIPVSIYGVSHILKALYAEDHGLNYSELVSDGPYKEIHRSNMIRWGEGVRSEQPDFFCRATIPTDCTDDVVIISDCRRPSDIEYFQNNYETLKVRITASDEERKRRGFEFVDGIDDMPSECALDDYPHDFVIINDNSCELGDQLHAVVQSVQRVLSS